MNRALAEASVTVLLPGELRNRAGGRQSVLVTGGTLRAVIDALELEHPGLRFNLCYETGELRPFVNVFVNGANVRYGQGLDTPVPAGATIHILPSVAGG
jgi:molybdopterin synthase sulfur carrier subunit